jgi:signal transduction histidine kinase
VAKLHQTILLLTPSPTIAAIFEATATVLQCRIKHLHTTAEASAYLQTHPVSLVVLDQDISKHSTLTLLNDLLGPNQNTRRALILNADVDLTQIVEALNQAQVSLVFRKPLVDPRLVIKILRESMVGKALPASSENSYAPTNPLGIFPIEKTQKIERLYTLGEIANGVIHQFNNVLTIMNGHLELLFDELGEIQDVKLQNRVQTILKAGEDGARLTRTIQNFVRTSQIPSQEFSLNEIIMDTIDMTEPVWGRGSTACPIEITTHLQPTSPITGNPGEIREALTNLVINAIDAMPHGGCLSFHTQQINETIQLKIADSGIGMAKSVREHIFEPFFTTKGEKGNGLGLGIVSRILRNHSGDIHVNSEPGHGTTFTLTLPATRCQEQHHQSSFVSALA